MTRYERMIESGFKPVIVFIARGCSRKGNGVKRDGKYVECGHEHRTRAAAQKCVKKMRATKPGSCQDYRVAELHRFRITRSTV